MIIDKLRKFIIQSNRHVFTWVKPLSIKIWWMWFLYAAKGDFLFKILTSMTLKVSKTGIFIMATANTARFSTFVEKKL